MMSSNKHPIRTCFFVSCPRLDATNSKILNIQMIYNIICDIFSDDKHFLVVSITKFFLI